MREERGQGVEWSEWVLEQSLLDRRTRTRTRTRGGTGGDKAERGEEDGDKDTRGANSTFKLRRGSCAHPFLFSCLPPAPSFSPTRRRHATAVTLLLRRVETAPSTFPLPPRPPVPSSSFAGCAGANDTLTSMEAAGPARLPPACPSAGRTPALPRCSLLKSSFPASSLPAYNPFSTSSASSNASNSSSPFPHASSKGRIGLLGAPPYPLVRSRTYFVPLIPAF